MTYNDAQAWKDVKEQISTGPMVKMGRLVFEIDIWMVEKNILP